LRRFSLCQAAEELLVTGIRLLLRRVVVAALPGLVVLAHLEVAEAAELLVLVVAVEPHLLAAVHLAAVAVARLAAGLLVVGEAVELRLR
jgi:hypothetical protein